MQNIGFNIFDRREPLIQPMDIDESPQKAQEITPALQEKPDTPPPAIIKNPSQIRKNDTRKEKKKTQFEWWKLAFLPQLIYKYYLRHGSI